MITLRHTGSQCIDTSELGDSQLRSIMHIHAGGRPRGHTVGCTGRAGGGRGEAHERGGIAARSVERDAGAV